jgi:hypothetical protein
MFIRRRNYNKPLANILLVVFLFCSAFTQSSGIVSSFVKALGCSIEKSSTNTSAAHQLPYEETEKEEKKSEDKTLLLSHHAEGVLFTLFDLLKHCSCSDRSSFTDASYPPLYLLIRTLRL